MTVHIDALSGGVFGKEFELVAQAGADGDLRCDTCGIVVTLNDPFARGSKMVWLDVTVWVEDGQPHARCRSHDA